MKISELLATKGSFVATIAPDVPVIEVVRGLGEHNVGALVVSSDGVTVEGIVSERDVVRAIDRLGTGVLDEPVRTIMSADVHTSSIGDTVESLTAIMTEHRVRHLPVVENGRLVGMVSIGDLVKTRMVELEHDRDLLVDYINAR